MSKMVTNAQLVKDNFVESFRESLRNCLTAAAAVLDVDEIKTTSEKVLEDVLSFLVAPADGSSTEDRAV